MAGLTTFTGDFCRLVPRNRIAQVLFSKTYTYVQENDTFHLQFMIATKEEPLHDPVTPVEDSTEYDTEDDADLEGSAPNGVTYLGHFILSFNEQRLPEMAHLGWRVGRGTANSPANRGVDLLLAQPRDKLGSSLASIHMIFRFHRESGFLMLGGGSSKVPVEFSKNGVWETLGLMKEYLMFQSSTIIRAGMCEYELQFTVEEKHRAAYFHQRDQFLEGYSSSICGFQPPVFKKLPGDICVVRGRYLEFATKGTGAYGWVTQGVDLETGNPIAIKEIRISRKYTIDEIKEELGIGRRFVDKTGLLNILDAFCEHGHPDPCCLPERFYIFMPHAQSDFTVHFWSDAKVPRNYKLKWLRDILEGIRTMHEMGIMHCDVRTKNMLIMSTEPPRASLCDFGKAIKAQSSNRRAIGTMSTCAPEVETIFTVGPYTAKIDMWAYGWAIAELLFFGLRKSVGVDYFDDENPVTRDKFQVILDILEADCRKKREDNALIDLVSKLLVWEPEKRWSAEQALQHDCWSPITGKEDVLEAGSSRTKRGLTSDGDLKDSDKRTKDGEGE